MSVDSVPSGSIAAVRDRLEAAGVAAVAEEPGEAYRPHAEFERDLDGEGRQRYPVPTDCTGTLRVVDRAKQLWIVVCDGCGFEVGVQMRRADPEGLTRHLLANAGIPSLFVGREFEKGDPLQEPTLSACRAWLRGFKDSPVPAVALWGQPGRGKSHLLALMVETIISRYGVEAVYRSMSELLDEMRTAAREGSFDMRWRRVLNVPVLALDDLGAGRLTDAAREWLAALVDHRYAKGLPLLAATNIPPPAWEGVFGERTSSRLRGVCVPLHLEGRDRRGGLQASFMDTE